MQFTEQNFQQEVEQSKALILVEFFAEWCGPCRMMGPIIEELAEEFKSQKNVKIGKLNIDENTPIAEKYGIMSIPTLILFKDGKKIEQLVGLQDKDLLRDLINKSL